MDVRQRSRTKSNLTASVCAVRGISRHGDFKVAQMRSICHLTERGGLGLERKGCSSQGDKKGRGLPCGQVTPMSSLCFSPLFGERPQLWFFCVVKGEQEYVLGLQDLKCPQHPTTPSLARAEGSVLNPSPSVPNLSSPV